MRLTRLARQALAEFLGSAGLVTVVIGSGIAAQRLSPDDVGLQLLENALITGAGLVALILAFGPVSGGHFNPVVTLADRFFGGVTNRQVAVYLPAQLVGGVLGAVVANLMFDLPAVAVSTHRALRQRAVVVGGRRDVRPRGADLRAGPRGQGRAGPVRRRRVHHRCLLVSPVDELRQPHDDVARTLSDTFAGIAPASVPMFLLMQLVGGAAAVAVVALLYPGAVADAVVVPHDGDRRDVGSPHRSVPKEFL